MLRLNLLRNLPVESPSAPRHDGSAASGTLRHVLVVLLVLLVLGAGSLYLVKPEWMSYVGTTRYFGGGKHEAARETVRADSIRRARILQAEVSRMVAERQSVAIEWLLHLETVFPLESGEHAMTFSSFTFPNEFQLRGTAGTGGALSAIQESLVLLLGMNLLQSRAREIEGRAREGFQYLFAGTVEFEAGDSVVTVNRITTAGQIETLLAASLQSAVPLGITFSPPEPGAAAVSGTLRVHPFRLAGFCDSGGFEAVRNFLEAEYHRGSPFAVQRVTLDHRSGKKAVFLDILAFSP
jgi:hypothetical protein